MKELIEKLKYKKHQAIDNERVSVIIHLQDLDNILKTLTALRQTEWVSVEERLPENFTKVTFYNSDGVQGDLSAHGITESKAKEDLRFKKMALKFKSDGITMDSIINKQIYRMITGACDLGCKQWMSANNIEDKDYKVGDVLGLLEKTNAYGINRLKEIIK